MLGIPPMEEGRLQPLGPRVRVHAEAGERRRANILPGSRQAAHNLLYWYLDVNGQGPFV